MEPGADFDLLEREGVRSWFAALGRQEGLSDTVIVRLWAEGKTGDDVRYARHLKDADVSDSELVTLIESHAPLDTAHQVIVAGASALDVVRWWDACDLPLTSCALLLSMGQPPGVIDRLDELDIPLGFAAQVMAVRGVTLEQLCEIHAAGVDGREAGSALSRGVPFTDVLTWGKAGLDLYRISSAYPVIATEPDPKVRETFAVLCSDGLEAGEAIKSARALSGVREVAVPVTSRVAPTANRSL